MILGTEDEEMKVQTGFCQNTWRRKGGEKEQNSWNKNEKQEKGREAEKIKKKTKKNSEKNHEAREKREDRRERTSEKERESRNMDKDTQTVKESEKVLGNTESLHGKWSRPHENTADQGRKRREMRILGRCGRSPWVWNVVWIIPEQ